jgi:hypothetical protein
MNRPRRVSRPKSAASAFSFVAPKPALTGDPGERVAECVATETKRRGTKWQLTLTFETDEGETGRMWCELPEPLTPTCRYMRLVRRALGCEPRADTPIHPNNVFKGKRFTVMVGWRKSSQDDRGKHRFDEALALKGPKDSHDFLRVHDLGARVDP